MTMDRRQWNRPTDSGKAYARAGGRRRYNHRRQIIAAERRALVSHLSLQLLREGIAEGQPFRGKQAIIANVLGVHPSTISRDLKRSRELSLYLQPCPTCGHRMPYYELADILSSRVDPDPA